MTGTIARATISTPKKRTMFERRDSPTVARRTSPIVIRYVTVTESLVVAEAPVVAASADAAVPAAS